ncbi:MAG: hypothetical protein J1F67_11115 [Muribaculaceae bacterium]|nr:hypothetical protein [Muribaculaceae bacterium]
MTHDDLALHYENIIRFANNDCERYEVPGADADIYRDLQQEYIEPSNDFEKGMITGKVIAYLKTAFDKLKKNYPSHNEDWESLDEQLSSAEDLDSFNELINNASKLISEIRSKQK